MCICGATRILRVAHYYGRCLLKCMSGVYDQVATIYLFKDPTVRENQKATLRLLEYFVKNQGCNIFIPKLFRLCQRFKQHLCHFGSIPQIPTVWTLLCSFISRQP